MSVAAYLCTPKQSSTELVDITLTCPPPPRRVVARDTYTFDDNSSPAFPTLDTRKEDFFLVAPKPRLLDCDDKEFLSFQIPMLQPRPSSSRAMMAVPISTLKPRPAKPVADVDMKMNPYVQNSYQLVVNKKQKVMKRSPSFHSPAA